jgi:hypothetical protein
VLRRLITRATGTAGVQSDDCPIKPVISLAAQQRLENYDEELPPCQYYPLKRGHNSYDSCPVALKIDHD